MHFIFILIMAVLMGLLSQKQETFKQYINQAVDNRMNNNRLILSLDSQQDKQRQRQLYNHNLKYDPDRPIYQHTINLSNIIQIDCDQAFRQFVRNIIKTYPDQKIQALAADYENTQLDIDSLKEGYLDQLTEKLQQTNKNLRAQLNELSEKIKKALQLQKQTKRELITKYRQARALNLFVSKNKFKIQQMNQIKKEHEEISTSLQEECQQLDQEIKSRLNQFYHMYHNIEKQLKPRKQLQLKLLQVRQQIAEKQTTKDFISKQSKRLQNQVSALQSLLQRQTQHLNKNHKSKSHINGFQIIQEKSHESQSKSVTSSNQNSENGANKVRFINKQKQVIHINKIQNGQCLFWFLVVATILLALYTFYRIFVG